MTARIADAGFIIALSSPDKGEREWARGQLEKRGAPFITCETALSEASHFCSPALIARLIADHDLVVAFDLAEQIAPVIALLEKYEEDKMDLVDACIVRMTELYPDCEVFSVGGDYRHYRRFRDQAIPLVSAPE